MEKTTRTQTRGTKGAKNTTDSIRDNPIARAMAKKNKKSAAAAAAGVPVTPKQPVIEKKVKKDEEDEEEEDEVEEEMELLQVDVGDIIKVKQILDETVAGTMISDDISPQKSHLAGRMLRVLLLP